MSNVSDLERRLSRALDRIAKTSQAFDAGTPEPDLTAELEQARKALEEEQAKSAQLAEQVAALRAREANATSSVDRRLARMTEQLDLQGLEMQRLKKANTKLIAANRQLREGHEVQVIEPSTINKSLVAELEALRAERAAEAAELQDVLGELKPLISPEDTNA